MQKIIDSDVDKVRQYLQELQKNIISMAYKYDNKNFYEDSWSRNEGGGGITCVLQDGSCFDKVGVNFSDISGDQLPEAATNIRPELQGRNYQAMGVSVVCHPKNPHIPTAHLNVRLFIAYNKNSNPVWWFGGGFDMTPYYGYEEDAIHWHKTANEVCSPFGKEIYDEYKKNCDDYFHIKHRNEQRGIGGIFFDDLNIWEFEKCFNFIKSVGNGFIKAYEPIVKKRLNESYSDKQKDFQLFRRGRYAEFNLVYDRGTLFGLQSNGRTESILMSMPPLVKWKYKYEIEKDSDEEKLYSNFLVPKKWI
ncbi:MAG: oxygen-dependent coproporphyrinogen oxidase [Gammaproteobacteria bacterium]|jgi:coproporphyrinogen III oxidase|nr:oxygen-dependent coproporphyrinogen oxidase [Gammaproteobacteria bacterium]MBT6754484.1 oxygen-dependent coproporphyrinogen oxidase [Gammaproteobacteria bacterium]MBT7522900.1 oxygen-dependent coproporphyrinogen oxidase [Gammaproteobacteria bacterium]MBT7814637.1 oxygen-dependent coproporphyrinogen oxidase [Gammaproteobacteria bacterium]|tara:strand:+ start:217 stop:1131 length:915 start_codon:yes stop_codon:yes gene_type:complete